MATAKQAMLKDARKIASELKKIKHFKVAAPVSGRSMFGGDCYEVGVSYHATGLRDAEYYEVVIGRSRIVHVKGSHDGMVREIRALAQAALRN